MGKPDARCLHALDLDRLYGAAEETLYHHLGASLVYDGGMFHLLAGFARGNGFERGHFLYLQRRLLGGSLGMVLRLVS